MLLAGGFAAQHSRVAPDSDIGTLLLVASVVMLGCRYTRYPGCFLFGLGWFFLAAQAIVDHRLQPRFAGDSLLADVRVAEFPKRTGPSVSMIVEPLADHRLPRRSSVSWFEPPLEPELGDIWRLELRLKRPRGLSNPGVFDREAWLFRNRIHASGYVVGGKRNQRLQQGTESGVDAFRRRFVERAREAARSSETGAVLGAIGVGARHGIGREQWHRYAVTGTSHLMAISGLHIGLAASAAFLLARALLLFLPLIANTHIVAILAGVVCAGSYAAVSGMGVPAERAFVMLLIAAFFLCRRRNVRPLETLALAATVVYVLDPLAIMAPGFHLSFAAVLLLLWLTRLRRPPAGRRGFFARSAFVAAQLFSMQLFLLFGLMPLTVLFFQRIAILALPVNLLAVPLFSFVTVPLTLLGLLPLLGTSAPGSAALKIAAQSVDWLEALIAVAVALPATDIGVASIEGSAWIMVLLPALFALLPRGWPGRYVAVLAIPVLISQAPERPAHGCMDTVVLDVGQGLATVVRTRNHTLVFDTGASYRGGGSVAAQVLIPFLESRGLRQIDWLVVSHADIDHSGGVVALADYADIGELLSGEPLPGTGRRATRCTAGQSWIADGVRFRVLHPPGASSPAGNDASCVVLADAGGHRLLLTGDIEAGAERRIVESHALGGIDAVVVPHHGSLTSSSAAFVDAVKPGIAIVSSGFANRWGLPKADVASRWRDVGAELVNTATSGAVSFRICRDGGMGPIRRDRYQRRRFWRDGAG